jgi:hypothetical protein
MYKLLSGKSEAKHLIAPLSHQRKQVKNANFTVKLHNERKKQSRIKLSVDEMKYAHTAAVIRSVYRYEHKTVHLVKIPTLFTNRIGLTFNRSCVHKTLGINPT